MTIKNGQLVHWPHAPGQIAQVIELRRRNVRLFYRCRTGRIHQPIVPAKSIQPASDHLPLLNPMGRAMIRGVKTFKD